MSQVSVRNLAHVTDIHHSDVHEINQLLEEFSPEAEKLHLKEIRAIARDDVMFVARDSVHGIVGMATLIIYRKPTGLVGVVEDVVVSERCRRKGVGRKLMEYVIHAAERKKLKYVELTSSKRREAARSLYQSLGFKARDTTCFRLKLQ